MNDKKEASVPDREYVGRKDIGERKKIQTAEGWRRTMLKKRDAKRKKPVAKGGTS